MITTHLMGGLGNQMFQYAAGLRLAHHHQTKLRIDLSWFGGVGKTADTPRVYELGCFNISAEITPTGWRRWLEAKPATLAEQGFAFNPNVLAAPDNVSLLGYWQSPKYFEDIAEQVRQEFSLKSAPTGHNQQTLDAIKGVQAVSLHVRRGDYVSSQAAAQHHGTKSLDYYHQAIDYIAKKVKKPHFFVISDDPVWCKANLEIGHPATYIDHNPPDKGYEDMRLMSACQHHITANSSFSWWGAWLNPNPDKIVVAPKQWFNDTSIDTSDLIPKSWVRL